MKSSKAIIIFLICSILTTSYIFYNSFQPKAESKNTSETVTEIVKPIVDPQDKIPKEKMDKTVRKIAHGIEFGVLGIFLALLFKSIKLRFNRTDISSPLLVALIVAVTDEFIQTFTGRGSLVKDVLIDFGGAIIGIGIVMLILYIIKRKGTVEF